MNSLNIKNLAAIAVTLIAASAHAGTTPDKKCAAGTCSKKTAAAHKASDASCSKKAGEEKASDASCSKKEHGKEASCSKKASEASCSKK